MNVGICVCVLLAALSSGSLSLPSHATVRNIHRVVLAVPRSSRPLRCPSQSQKAQGEALVGLLSDNLPTRHTRQARSAPAPPSGQFTNYNPPQDGADARNSLSQLLARLLSRKGEPQTAELTQHLRCLIGHARLILSRSRRRFIPLLNRPSLMLCLRPTIWHFLPPSSLLLFSFLLSFLKSPPPPPPSSLSVAVHLC